METNSRKAVPKCSSQQVSAQIEHIHGRSYPRCRPDGGRTGVCQFYTGHHKLYVVGGNGLSLLGRSWLQHLHLDWASIRLIDTQRNFCAVEELTTKYAGVFQEGLGTTKNVQASLKLYEGATRRFCRPHTVPFATKEAVKRKLDQLEADGILRKVDHSEWAAPIVPVPKWHHPNLWRLQSKHQSSTASGPVSATKSELAHGKSCRREAIHQAGLNVIVPADASR